MREALSQNNIRFAYLDISASIMNLKRFLTVRDTADSYAEIREGHYVGVPCLQIEDRVMYIDGVADIDALVKEGAFL